MIFNIQRYCVDDGDGIRTCVFFKGCPLQCEWCHNIESWSFEAQEEFDPAACIHCGNCKRGCPSGARRIIGKDMTAEEIMQVVRRDRPFYGDHGGMTVTGGEPMAQFDLVYELACMAKAEGISFMMETSGYANTEDYKKIAPLCDCFLFDCKASTKKHKELTGVEDALILCNLDVLYRMGASILLRCPIVPSGNLDDDFIEKIVYLKERYPNLRVELMPYHRAGTAKAGRLGMSAQKEYPVPSRELLERIREKIGDAEIAI